MWSVPTTARRRRQRSPAASSCRPAAGAAGRPAAPAPPGPFFTGGDRRRPAGRGRRLGAGAPSRAVRRGDAGRACVHEPPHLRPALPVPDRQRAAAVADHPARAPGAASAGDVGLLRGRGGRPLRLPLARGAARPLPPPARRLARRVPRGVPGGGRRPQEGSDARCGCPGTRRAGGGRGHGSRWCRSRTGAGGGPGSPGGPRSEPGRMPPDQRHRPTLTRPPPGCPSSPAGARCGRAAARADCGPDAVWAPHCRDRGIAP